MATVTAIGPLPRMASVRAGSNSSMVQSTSAGKPISFMCSSKVPPISSAEGPPFGKLVWVAFHAPYADQSVNCAQILSGGAWMRASALISAMRPPLCLGLRCRGT